MSEEKRYKWLQILLFIVLSFLFVLPLQKNGVIYFGDDMNYHVNRIIELIKNFKHGNLFPYIYTYTFDKVGYPLGIFYPWITLTPFAFFSILLNNTVHGIYLGFVFYTFLTLIFTYVCVRRMKKSSFQANVVSIIYTFCAYRTIDAFSRFAIGEFLGMVFLPLCLYGIYAVMFGNRKDWPFLAFGVSFTLLSHVLSAFIIVLALSIIFVLFIWFVKDKANCISQLVKAIVVAFTSSSIFLFPFIEQELFQKYNPPSPYDVSQTANYMDEIVMSSLRNSVLRYAPGKPYGIGVVLLLVIILGLLLFKKFNLTSRIVYLLGLFSFVCASSLFPWVLLKHTPVSLIQFPIRILMLTSILLAYSGGDIAEILYEENNYSASWKNNLFKSVIILVIITPWFSSINQLKNDPLSNSEANKVSTGSMKEYKGASAWYLDQYTPKKSMNYFKDIQNHIALVNGKKERLRNISSQPNAQIYHIKDLKAGDNVNLPIALYKNMHVYQNGKDLSLVRNERNTIAFKTISNGSVVVKYIPSLIDKLGIILSFLTWLISLGYFIYTKIKQKILNI